MLPAGVGAAAAARVLLPASVAALYAIYYYVQSRRKPKLSEPIVVPDPNNNHSRLGFDPSDQFDPAILDEIAKFDPAVLDEIRKLDPAALDLIRNFDPAIVEEFRKFDPAALREIREFDPAIIDDLRRLCLKENKIGEEKAERSCSGRETETETKNKNERQREEGGGGEVEKKIGEESSIRYSYPLRPEAEDCSYYLKTGFCKYGVNCKFNHPVRRKTNQHYFGPGGRKHGKGCSFNHSRGEPSVAPMLGLNFLGLPIRPGEKECPYYMRNASCMYGTNCRFHHPDPESAGECEPLSGYGNGGLASLQGASSSSAAPWSAPRSFNDAPLYVPMMTPPSQGIPSRNTEWNGYQAPEYLQERNMHAPPPQYPQQKQVEELPERPGQLVCIYCSRIGGCKFKSCKFDHPKNQTAASPSCAISDKGLPLRPGENICTQYSQYGICNYGTSCKFDHPSLSPSFLL